MNWVMKYWCVVFSVLSYHCCFGFAWGCSSHLNLSMLLFEATFIGVISCLNTQQLAPTIGKRMNLLSEYHEFKVGYIYIYIHHIR